MFRGEARRLVIVDVVMPERAAKEMNLVAVKSSPRTLPTRLTCRFHSRQITKQTVGSGVC
jgi:hypothetical protein